MIYETGLPPELCIGLASAIIAMKRHMGMERRIFGSVTIKNDEKEKLFEKRQSA